MTKRVPQTFHVGDKVVVQSTIHRVLSGKHGVIRHIQKNIYAQELDRYTVHIDDEQHDVALWDIEIERAAEK